MWGQLNWVMIVIVLGLAACVGAKMAGNKTLEAETLKRDPAWIKGPRTAPILADSPPEPDATAAFEEQQSAFRPAGTEPAPTEPMEALEPSVAVEILAEGQELLTSGAEETDKPVIGAIERDPLASPANPPVKIRKPIVP